MTKLMSKGFIFPSSSSDCGEIYDRLRLNLHGICSFPNKSVNLSCLPSLKLSSSCLPRTDFYGRRLVINEGLSNFNRRVADITAQMSVGIKKAQKWWEKGVQPNMKEVNSAQELVDSLLSAGDKLVVVDFFSPGCGGCKALHPKLCQLAEMNPDVQFLQVNYEEHKSMCYSLNVHVLPFFRFYRGAEGRVCSFSCTNATIKKFRDALAKYGTDRCTIGSPKGLEEKELLALAANKDLSFNYTPKTEEEPILVTSQKEVRDRTTPNIESPLPLPLPLPITSTSSQTAKRDTEKEAYATSGR
ncbi:thioredoxin-like 1-1, chloroplastic [Solanum lycopersicum]|uniref:Thioredoxin domain-containing protein n=1 Tax=Solanum lycopersicum TaxID=4081 RepID=A0A3Q7JUA8_SOLLC|nr:thioredoxin-like 1-1, chloroplastic [Solanum lycopersicum]